MLNYNAMPNSNMKGRCEMKIESYKCGPKEYWIVEYNNALHYFYNMLDLSQWLRTTRGDI